MTEKPTSPIQSVTRIRMDGVQYRTADPLEDDVLVPGSGMMQGPPGGGGVRQIIQPTELGEALKQLNDDTIEPETRMSGIDMRARLHPAEISSVLALDALVALGVCPIRCLSFTRQKKRLSRSLNGAGSAEIVAIVQGKREQDKQQMSFGQKVGSAFGFGGKTA